MGGGKQHSVQGRRGGVASSGNSLTNTCLKVLLLYYFVIATHLGKDVNMNRQHSTRGALSV